MKKLLSMALCIVLCLNFASCGADYEKQLQKPELILKKQVICSTEETPKIMFDNSNKDCEIYYCYFPKGEEDNENYLKYNKMIQINRYSEDEVISDFTLKAYSKAKDGKKSEIAQYNFVFDPSTDDSGGDCIKCNPIKEGDSSVSGTINDNSLTKKLRKTAVLCVKHNGKKTEYKSEIKDGKFTIKLDNPLKKSEIISLTADSKDKVVNYYKSGKAIHIWEEYFVFYCGDLDKAFN